MWDVNTPLGSRIEARLAEEIVIWLVTNSASGTPQPSPVWFLREGHTLLIYSRPDAPKVRNIARSPQVALHFNTTPDGDDVIIFHGTAAFDPDAPPSNEHAAYQAKYQEGITHLGSDPEKFAQAYSAALRVTIEKVRGF